MTPTAPVPDADSAPFWAATLENRLDLQRCRTCGIVVFYPRARCPACHTAELTWETMSGRGVVHAFTIVHRAPDPARAQDVPYVVALVDLDEGARLMTNLVGCAVDDVSVGMPVVVRFHRVSDQAALPLFAPAGTGAGSSHA